MKKAQFRENLENNSVGHRNEKTSEARYSDNLHSSLDSKEKLGKIKRLQDLERNYDYIQKELIKILIKL